MPRSVAERQADTNRAAADPDVFAGMLLAALERPDVRDAIIRTVGRPVRRGTQQRTPTVTSAAAARDLKANRLRERGSRG